MTSISFNPEDKDALTGMPIPQNNPTEQSHRTIPQNNSTEQSHRTIPQNNPTEQSHRTIPQKYDPLTNTMGIPDVFEKRGMTFDEAANSVFRNINPYMRVADGEVPVKTQDPDLN